MADILSQDEVDLLLNAVASGEVDTNETTEPSSPLDSHPDLVTYDFRRPERVSKEQLKGLQSLFDAFARELNIVLPPFLRSVVRVDLNSIDQLTYDEFILSVSRPTSLAVIDMAPLEGNAVLELNPGMVFPIVDRVLGGRGASISQPRELTEIEDRILNRLMDMILDCWQRSWAQLIEFDLSVVTQESDPLIIQIVAGSEMTILVGYQIHVGEIVGTMNVCVPLVVLNPILDQISQQAHFKRKMPPELAVRTRDQIQRCLRSVNVPVEAVLGRVQLTLNDLAHLQTGDVIPLSTEVNAPIPVQIGGQTCFLARCGRHKDQSAVQITDVVTG